VPEVDVTTTVQDILDAAYAKSRWNVPGQTATEDPELLEVVGRAQRGLFTLGARVNPVAFAMSEDLVADGGTAWWWPDALEALLRLEVSGSEVIVVPFDQRGADPGRPAVYYLGNKFYPSGNAADPTPGSDTLTAWFAKRPAMPTALTDELDPLWREAFNDLLSLEVAIHMALKEHRDGELATLQRDRDKWLTQYVAHLEHVVPFEVRGWGHTRVTVTNQIVPLRDLVAGSTGAV
jgi:hypothetical protein